MRNDDLEWEYEDGWWKFGSVDNLNILFCRKSKRGLFLNLRKIVLLGRLNDGIRKKFVNDVWSCFGLGVKCNSEEKFKWNNDFFGVLKILKSDE